MNFKSPSIDFEFQDSDHSIKPNFLQVYLLIFYLKIDFKVK
jgi:hypothetical protein